MFSNAWMSSKKFFFSKKKIKTKTKKIINYQFFKTSKLEDCAQETQHESAGTSTQTALRQTLDLAACRKAMRQRAAAPNYSEHNLPLSQSWMNKPIKIKYSPRKNYPPAIHSLRMPLNKSKRNRRPSRNQCRRRQGNSLRRRTPTERKSRSCGVFTRRRTLTQNRGTCLNRATPSSNNNWSSASSDST